MHSCSKNVVQFRVITTLVMRWSLPCIVTLLFPLVWYVATLHYYSTGLHVSISISCSCIEETSTLMRLHCGDEFFSYITLIFIFDKMFVVIIFIIWCQGHFNMDWNGYVIHNSMKISFKLYRAGSYISSHWPF